jgi:hypothetical protein
VTAVWRKSVWAARTAAQYTFWSVQKTELRILVGWSPSESAEDELCFVISRGSRRVVRDADARCEACALHVPTPPHALLGGDPLM